MKLVKNKLLAMMIAGGLAGIGGTLEILGVQYRLMSGFSNNFGFDGIAVALLGANTPGGIALSGLLFGALRSGAGRMEMAAGVPSAIIFMIQGLVILFVIGRALFVSGRFSKKRFQTGAGAIT